MQKNQIRLLTYKRSAQPIPLQLLFYIWISSWEIWNTGKPSGNAPRVKQFIANGPELQLLLSLWDSHGAQLEQCWVRSSCRFRLWASTGTCVLCHKHSRRTLLCWAGRLHGELHPAGVAALFECVQEQFLQKYLAGFPVYLWKPSLNIRLTLINLVKLW